MMLKRLLRLFGLAPDIPIPPPVAHHPRVDPRVDPNRKQWERDMWAEAMNKGE